MGKNHLFLIAAAFAAPVNELFKFLHRVLLFSPVGKARALSFFLFRARALSIDDMSPRIARPIEKRRVFFPRIAFNFRNSKFKFEDQSFPK